MLAIAQRSRVYPVLLPRQDSAARQTPHGAGRRLRTSPTVRAVAVALLVVLPAAFYVYERAQVARTGYLILQLQHEVHALQTQRDRLLATAVALKTPERIEHIATAELGMVPPRQQQMAALTVAPAVAGPIVVGRRSAWDQLRSWLAGEAEARETR